MQWRSKATVDVVDQWAEGRNLSTQQQDGSRNKKIIYAIKTVDVVDQWAERSVGRREEPFNQTTGWEQK